MKKKLLKQGVCIAACSTMLVTGATQMIPLYQNTVVLAEDAATTESKTFTADQLEVVWGNAQHELADGLWKLSFLKQYDQVKWKVPEEIDIESVKSVTFKVADQKGTVTLKVYNGGDDASGDNTRYGLSGSNEYSIEPKGEGKIDAIGLMTTDEDGAGSSIDLESVTFELDTTPKAPPQIEQEIPDWKDSVTSGDALGNNAIAGTAIMESEITDNTLMDLVEKHFNAVTFGNELKPDAIFNYQLDSKVNTKTIQFNGQELEVPIVNDAGDSLDFSRADKMADKILEWNEANPDKKIRIRGHVLVWHSQTPEWFFHENYDISKPYVDTETMNMRLEWYISGVFDHFFGEAADGKYDGLFYGWDVVNEAVIGTTYRTDKVSAAESLDEIRHGNNSSWWHVYNSNEFIINAFKYANKYAPEDVELYYNDFGETDNAKSEGILKLINDVKSAEGTRLDAFGMQAHYGVDSFSASQFKKVAEKYAEAAGKVQLTELDFQSSAGFRAGSTSKDSEYTRMAYCHKQVFDSIKELKGAGTNVSGITVWGVIEPNSWLHTSSGVGGGADGSKQCPLLFDGRYKAKPAYWAYVDDTKLEPSIQNIVIPEKKDGIDSGCSYEISQNDIEAAFVPQWDKDGLNVKVTVSDNSVDEEDSVTVYVDEANSAKDDATPIKVTVKRSECEEIEGGYAATVKVPITELSVAKVIGMDVSITNADKKANFNDMTGKQDSCSKYYAKATLKPGVEKVTKATIKVDGEYDDEWKKAADIPLTINLGSNVKADAKVLWDDENLYVYAAIKDPVLNSDSGNEYEQDSLEVFIDENNAKTESYDDDDKQYRINYNNIQSFNGKKCNADNVKSFAKTTEDGYIIEAAYKWTDITPSVGSRIGLEFQINDADESGARIGTLSWNDETGMGWSKSSVYGTVQLAEAYKAESEKKDDVKTDTEKKDDVKADTEKKDDVKADTEKKDDVKADTEKKDDVKADTEKKDDVKTDTEKKDDVKTDTEKKDDVKTDTEKKNDAKAELVSGGAINAILKDVSGILPKGVEFTSKKVTDEAIIKKIHDIVNDKIRGVKEIAVFEFNLSDGTNLIHKLDGKVQVETDIPFKISDGETIKVYRVDGDKLIACDTKITGDKLVFETDHFSTYAFVKTSKDGNNIQGGTNVKKSDTSDNLPAGAWITVMIMGIALAAASKIRSVKNNKK